MIFLKKLIIIISAIAGSAAGIIFLLTFDHLASVGLTFSQVFIFGMLFGSVLGVFFGLILAFHLAGQGKKEISKKLFSY